MPCSPAGTAGPARPRRADLPHDWPPGGLDAWTELTAARLGLEASHVGEHPDRHDQAATQALVDAGADVVLAFPLTSDSATGAPVSDPITADAIGRAEAAGLAVLTHTTS